MTISQFPIPAGGIPTGDTAGRPASPAIGEVYYNGETGVLEIFDGVNFIACSAPPSPPTLATPTDTSAGDAFTSTAGELTIEFTPGVGGGLVGQFNAFTTAEGHSAFSSGTTVTITGLTPGTSYTVFGNAQNNFGTSVNSANAAAVTPTTLPQVPTIGTATTSSITTDVVVTWTLGNNGGKNLSAITVTPFLDGTTAQTATTAATTSSTSATIVGLTSGDSYTFKVKTTNANGTSADSTATGSVTVPTLITIDFLVVAGGGGGGDGRASIVDGSGGGAGGLRSSVTATGGGGSLESALNRLLSTNYTVTVGGGGASQVKGTNSVFDTVTSEGGGRGVGITAASNTMNGGSGGGGGNGTTTGLGTANQGFNGSGNGGGGGATEVGGTDGFGQGGDGVATLITGSSVTTGGGGGGADNNGGAGASGGLGGGGNGNFTNNADPGTVNTGGGGGGARSTSGDKTGGAGGSGVVVLRWLTSSASITVGAGLTADSTGTDGSHSYKRFTAGSGNVSFS